MLANLELVPMDDVVHTQTLDKAPTFNGVVPEYSVGNDAANRELAEQSTLTQRADEGDSVHFRSGRFYNAGGEYYFSTREGMEVGPFGSKKEAAMGLERFVHCLKTEECVVKAKQAAETGSWAITNFQ